MQAGRNLLNTIYTTAASWARVDALSTPELKELFDYLVIINEKNNGVMNDEDKLALKNLFLSKLMSDPFFLLNQAVAIKDEKLLHLLEKAGVDLHQKDGNNDNILTKACVSGNVGFVKKIMAMGFSLTEKNKFDITPLEELAKAISSAEMFNFLPSIDPISLEGLEILMKHANSKELVEALIERGAQLDTPDTLGRTVLYRACQMSPINIEFIKFLIEKGANPKRVNLVVQRKHGDIDKLEHQMEANGTKNAKAIADLKIKRDVLAPLTPFAVIEERCKNEINNELPEIVAKSPDGQLKKERIAALTEIAKLLKIELPTKQPIQRKPLEARFSVFVDAKHYASVWEAIRWDGLRAAHDKAVKDAGLGGKIFHGIAYILESVPVLGQLIGLIELAVFKIFSWLKKPSKDKENISVDKSKETGTNNVTKPNGLLIPFYLNQGKDSEGRELSKIWAMSDAEKESNHDYIQWLFPAREMSKYNPNAPVLDDKLAEEMRKNPKILENVTRSFEVMMSFYGLTYDAKAKVVNWAPNFKERSKVWLTPGNHNFLRITRILKCLRDLGLNDQEQAFMGALTKINLIHHETVGGAFNHWAGLKR
jgi:ankyrin repeat protein